MSNTYKITKITAAGCQLDTAISLLFKNDEDVSICVLVHSAWSILKDLHINRGSESSRDWMAACFPNNKPKDIWNTLDSTWNFFKHAKTDSHVTLDFDTSYLETALMLALNDFGLLSVQSTSMDVYQLWFIAKNYKEYFTGDGCKKTVQIARNLFPDLLDKQQSEQRLVGLQELDKQIALHIKAQQAPQWHKIIA